MSKFNDLPKDILVQLISTIQEDTEKEIYEKIFQILNQIPGFYSCSFPGCSTFTVYNMVNNFYISDKGEYTQMASETFLFHPCECKFGCQFCKSHQNEKCPICKT